MPERWHRLNELQRMCETRIRSHLEPNDTLAWSIELRHKTRPDDEPLIAKREDLQDAVNDAVREAVRRGWIST